MLNIQRGIHTKIIWKIIKILCTITSPSADSDFVSWRQEQPLLQARLYWGTGQPYCQVFWVDTYITTLSVKMASYYILGSRFCKRYSLWPVWPFLSGLWSLAGRYVISRLNDGTETPGSEFACRRNWSPIWNVKTSFGQKKTENVYMIVSERCVNWF